MIEVFRHEMRSGLTVFIVDFSTTINYGDVLYLNEFSFYEYSSFGAKNQLYKFREDMFSRDVLHNCITGIFDIRSKRQIDLFFSEINTKRRT